MKLTVNDKEYDVEVASTEEEKEKGLSGRDSLEEGKGMLFIFDKPLTVGFWMKDTKFDLDICFLDEDGEVLSVYKAKALDETIVEEDEVKYVLEVNSKSGISKGDEVDGLEEDEDSDKSEIKMLVIAPDGSTQMELSGGERIFSRKNTKTLIRMAKRAEASGSDTDYKRLGNKMFKYILGQDTRKPEYIELKS